MSRGCSEDKLAIAGSSSFCFKRNATDREVWPYWYGNATNLASPPRSCSPAAVAVGCLVLPASRAMRCSCSTRTDCDCELFSGHVAFANAARWADWNRLKPSRAPSTPIRPVLSPTLAEQIMFFGALIWQLQQPDLGGRWCANHCRKESYCELVPMLPIGLSISEQRAPTTCMQQPFP